MSTRKKQGRRKTGGRKQGTPNHDYAAVRSVPRRCPTCAATAVRILRVISRQDHTGIAPDGEPYTEIIRKRGKCESCGQMLIVTEYENAGG